MDLMASRRRVVNEMAPAQPVPRAIFPKQAATVVQARQEPVVPRYPKQVVMVEKEPQVAPEMMAQSPKQVVMVEKEPRAALAEQEALRAHPVHTASHNRIAVVVLKYASAPAEVDIVLHCSQESPENVCYWIP